MDSTRSQTMCGALPTTRSAVTDVMVNTEIQCVMSKAHLLLEPSGRKKFSFFHSRQLRTANSMYVGPPQMVATMAKTAHDDSQCGRATIDAASLTDETLDVSREFHGIKQDDRNEACVDNNQKYGEEQFPSPPTVSPGER